MGQITSRLEAVIGGGLPSREALVAVVGVFHSMGFGFAEAVPIPQVVFEGVGQVELGPIEGVREADLVRIEGVGEAELGRIEVLHLGHEELEER
jgi:hypothetical protein